jgi:hypothetical protein
VWLGVDPLIGNNPEMTLFNFSGNNPIMNIDPDGLDHWKVVIGRATKINSNGDDIFVNGVKLDQFDFSSHANQQALSVILGHYFRSVAKNTIYDNSVSIVNYNSKYQVEGSACWDLEKYYFTNSSIPLMAAISKRFSKSKHHRILVPLYNGKLDNLLSNKYNLMNSFFHEDVHLTQNQTAEEYNGGGYGHLLSATAEAEAYSGQINHHTWNSTTKDYKSFVLPNFQTQLRILEPATGFGNRNQYLIWERQYQRVQSEACHRNVRNL